MSSHVVMSCRQKVDTQELVPTIQIPTLHDHHIPSNELLACQRSILLHDITRKGLFVRHRPLCAFRLPIESPSSPSHTHTGGQPLGLLPLPEVS